jgi:hypothetical protein
MRKYGPFVLILLGGALFVAWYSYPRAPAENYGEYAKRECAASADPDCVFKHLVAKSMSMQGAAR